MKRISDLDVLAARQHGLLTRSDVIDAGFTPKQLDAAVDRQTLINVFENVYRFAGSPTTTKQSLLAACLACHGAGVASHRSAAVLWGLSRVSAPGPEILVAGTSVGRLRGVHIHRTNVINPIDVMVV